MAATAWIASMWWLFAADGPLPVGDFLFSAGFVVTGLSIISWDTTNKYQSVETYYSQANSHGSGSSSKPAIKSVSTPANPEPPNNNNGNKNDNQGKGSFKKLTEQQLKRYGLDAHTIKREVLGQKAQISRYNMYYNTKTGEIFIAHNGTSHFIPTGYSIP